jgi:glycosyltransferase involved in cell wall biosynthesis
VPGATLEVHYKLFGTDGVSLQSQELSKELRRRGWTVHPCACDVPDGSDGLRLAELAYQSAHAVALRKRIFAAPTDGSDDSLNAAGSALIEEITARAAAIRQPVERYLDAHDIRLVHIRNVMSLPYNLPATVAFYGIAVDRPDIGFLMQHHDLYWEGPNARNFATQYPEIRELIERIMCPALPNARHTLINPIAGDALRERKGIDGTVIPDGFDFDREVVSIDELTFRGRLEILCGDSRPVGAADLVVAMPARVAINKSIELAIQLVAGLAAKRSALENAADGIGHNRRRFADESRVVLVLPQGEDLDDNREYFDRLVAYARQMGITLAYGGDIVVPDRRFQPGDHDHYPFYSTYQAVDLVCYPPEHEGFGNQAIEAVWARLPLAVFEYPVFQRYVRDHLPHYISLGDAAQLARLDDFGGLHQLREDVLERAVEGAIRVLEDHDTEQRWTEENVQALRAFCGIDVVADQYIRLYDELDSAAGR